MPEMTKQDKLFNCLEIYNKNVGKNFAPRVAVVLGSGLGGFADKAENVSVVGEMDYSEFGEFFPVSTVPGHGGRYVFGKCCGVPVVIMQGRVHYYEGYDVSDVVLPVRLMRLMGASALVLTNAVGSVNLEFGAGDFMLIRDHISSFVPNPLIGANLDKLGTRFPDMSEVYSKKLRERAKNAATRVGTSLREGVYLQTSGPSFETPAEIKMYRTSGADVVGMSTAVEAVAARHAGFDVCGISFVANLGCGITDAPLTHAEVLEASLKSAPVFEKLLREVIREVGEECNK